MRRYGKRKAPRSNSGQVIPYILLVCLLAGIAAGAAAANMMNTAGYTRMSSYLDNFIYGYQYNSASKMEVFKDSLVKYGKYAAAIWLLGFVPFGGIVSAALLGVRGVSLGFTAAALVKNYGLTGSIYAAVFCLPQNLLILPVYLFLCQSSIRFLSAGYEKGEGKPVHMSEYIAVLLISAACVTAACMIEAFVIPGFVW